MKDKTLIMIVDDDPNIAQLVKLYLEKDGYPIASMLCSQSIDERPNCAVTCCRQSQRTELLCEIHYYECSLKDSLKKKSPAAIRDY